MVGVVWERDRVRKGMRVDECSLVAILLSDTTVSTIIGR